MSQVLTLNMLTKQFVHLLANILRHGSGIELQFMPERPQFTQEVHADVVILPEHLHTKSLDDVSEELLTPAAWTMAEELKEANAGVTFEANGMYLGSDIECVVHRYSGISIRGMVMRAVDIGGLSVDAFRFEVFYREAQLQ